MKKKVWLLFLVLCMCFFACSKKDDAKKDESKNEKAEVKKNENTEEIDVLALTEDEKNDNWKSFTEIGFKVHMPKEISEKKDNVSARQIGDDEDESEAIYAGYLYRYVSDSTNKEFNEIVENVNMTNEEKREKIDKEVRPKVKDIFALVTLRAPLITDENPIEKVLETDDFFEVRRTSKYIQVVAFDKGDDVEGLTEEEIAEYKRFLDIARGITKGIEATDPVPASVSLQNIKNFKFDTVDLEGNQITQDVLAKNKITMVNIWATWCPPCRAELPDIGNLERAYREKGVAIIAICSDVTDEDDSALEEAKEIITDANCEFTVLRKNKSLNAIYNHIQAYPTTLFFDKDGNSIGNVIVGGRSEEDFAKALEELLAKVE